MFDPRSDIKGLFTNSRVTSTDKYGNQIHVDIHLREDNAENAIVREGVLILEPPRGIANDPCIGNTKKYDEVEVDASLYVVRKPNISDYPTFINSIVDNFENTIKTNRGSLSSCSDAIVVNMVSPPVHPNSKKTAFRRTITINCWAIT